MSLEPSVKATLDRLSPYLTVALERAGTRALRLHADEIALEHLIGATLEDEDSAAYGVVEHAFADPDTLANELLALSPGVMVVGSHATLPFSELALRALRCTVATRTADSAKVAPLEVLHASIAVLSVEQRAALGQAGYREPAGHASADGGATEIAPEGSPFKHFEKESLQLLSRANTAAHQAGEPSISPAQLVLAALAVSRDVAQAAGLTKVGAASVLHGQTADATPAPDRALGIEARLAEFIRSLPDKAGSIAVLRACHSSDTAEVMDLLARHKVTIALLDRSVDAFEDPV